MKTFETLKSYKELKSLHAERDDLHRELRAIRDEAAIVRKKLISFKADHNHALTNPELTLAEVKQIENDIYTVREDLERLTDVEAEVNEKMEQLLEKLPDAESAFIEEVAPMMSKMFAAFGEIQDQLEELDSYFKEVEHEHTFIKKNGSGRLGRVFRSDLIPGIPVIGREVTQLGKILANNKNRWENFRG